jgi:hypothetical protein
MKYTNIHDIKPNSDDMNSNIVLQIIWNNVQENKDKWGLIEVHKLANLSKDWRKQFHGVCESFLNEKVNELNKYDLQHVNLRYLTLLLSQVETTKSICTAFAHTEANIHQLFGNPKALLKQCIDLKFSHATMIGLIKLQSDYTDNWYVKTFIACIILIYMKLYRLFYKPMYDSRILKDILLDKTTTFSNNLKIHKKLCMEDREYCSNVMNRMHSSIKYSRFKKT